MGPRNVIATALRDAYEHSTTGADADDILVALYAAGYTVVLKSNDDDWGSSEPVTIPGYEAWMAWLVGIAVVTLTVVVAFTLWKAGIIR